MKKNKPVRVVKKTREQEVKEARIVAGIESPDGVFEKAEAIIVTVLKNVFIFLSSMIFFAFVLIASSYAIYLGLGFMDNVLTFIIGDWAASAFGQFIMFLLGMVVIVPIAYTIYKIMNKLNNSIKISFKI